MHVPGLKDAYWRVRQNYFLTSRLPEYRKVLLALKEFGYQFLTVKQFAESVRGEGCLPPRICMLRNDVDSDPGTALAMREEEVKLGITATYYFRLSTCNQTVMQSISFSGAEVGYHYEELATVAKRLHLRNREQVLRHKNLIKDEFRNNIRWFSTIAGFFPATIASHGDFANRALRMPNSDLLDDELRREFNIVAEAYDRDLEEELDARIIDRELPVYWSPESPFDAMNRGAGVVLLLVHPRQWRCSWAANFRGDLVRSFEGLRFRA